jgi:uncharacterized protein YndB with AHSA1/START domain
MARPPEIEQKFYYEVPPRKLFSALSDRRRLVSWFVSEAQLEPRAGTSFRFAWKSGYVLKGKVRRVKAPTTLELLWADRFEDGKSFKTVVRFTLRKRGRGTLLTVRHGGFKSGRRWVALHGSIAAGWAYYLTNLRSVLEHGIDLRNERDAVA